MRRDRAERRFGGHPGDLCSSTQVPRPSAHPTLPHKSLETEGVSWAQVPICIHSARLFRCKLVSGSFILSPFLWDYLIRLSGVPKEAPTTISPAYVFPSHIALPAPLTNVVSHSRYWDKEVWRAEKEGRKASLTKAIIKCYWKSYLILGLFTLIEVTTFIHAVPVFSVRG